MKIFKLKIFIAIVVIVLAGAAIYYFAPRKIKSLISSRSEQVGESLAPEVQGQKTYKNIKYGFSFGYPKEFTISEFTESNADVVLISDAKASGIFQISVSPWDEPGPITKERILKDIPGMAIADDKIISVGGISALSFRNKDKSGSETFEVWFVRGGNLYQISALSSFEGELLKILETWKFQ